MEYTFTSDNFEEEVLKSDVPVLVDMFATWCGPCKMMAPVVAQLAEEYFFFKIITCKCIFHNNSPILCYLFKHRFASSSD